MVRKKVSGSHKKPGNQGIYVEDGDHYNQDDNHDHQNDYFILLRFLVSPYFSEFIAKTYLLISFAIPAFSKCIIVSR